MKDNIRYFRIIKTYSLVEEDLDKIIQDALESYGEDDWFYKTLKQYKEDPKKLTYSDYSSLIDTLDEEGYLYNYADYEWDYELM